MTLRFLKWLIVVLLAAAVVLALRHSLREPADGPGLGHTDDRPPAAAAKV